MAMRHAPKFAMRNTLRLMKATFCELFLLLATKEDSTLQYIDSVPLPSVHRAVLGSWIGSTLHTFPHNFEMPLVRIKTMAN